MPGIAQKWHSPGGLEIQYVAQAVGTGRGLRLTAGELVAPRFCRGRRSFPYVRSGKRLGKADYSAAASEGCSSPRACATPAP